MSATSVGERSAFAATATKNASWQQRQEQRAWFEALTAQTSSLPPSPFVNAPDIGGDNRTKFDSYVESLRGVLKKTQSDSKLSSPSSVSNPSMVAVLEARLGALLCADTFHMPQQQMAVCEREVVPFLREVLLELRPVRSHPGWCLLYASACNELATALDSIGKYDEAEEMYNEMVVASPDTEYIVDFAVFTHKRFKTLKSMSANTSGSTKGVDASASSVNFAQDRIDRLYRRALEVFPNKASLNFKYATFLRHCRIPVKLPLPGLAITAASGKSSAPGSENTISALDAADLYYSRSVTLDPTLSEAFASYASFLYATRRFGDGAKGSNGATIDTVERLFMKAVELDPANMSALCNWGLFLSEEKRSFAKAENIYKRALAVYPKHVNTLYNYAVLLDTHNPPLSGAESAALQRRQSVSGGAAVPSSNETSRRAEAASLYARAIAENPTHSYALYNLAVLKEDDARTASTLIPHDYGSASAPASRSSSPSPGGGVVGEIASLYERAANSDLSDADLSADYGRFSLVYKGDLEAAGVALQRALECSDSNHEIALYNAALLKYSHVNDPVGAANLLRTLLLDVNPQHSVTAWQLLGRALMDSHHISTGGNGAASNSNGGRISSKIVGKGGIFASETNRDSVAGLLKILNGGNSSMTLVDCAQEALEKAVRLCATAGEREAILSEYLRLSLRVSTDGATGHKAKMRALAFGEVCLQDSRGNSSDVVTLIAQLKK